MACLICPLMDTKCFAESTSLKQKYPINLPNPKQSFNCETKIFSHIGVAHNTWATPPDQSYSEYSGTLT